MRSLTYLILPALVGIAVQLHAQAPADTAVHAVSYVDVMPSARASMVAALKQ